MNAATRVWRIEVWPTTGEADPHADEARAAAAARWGHLTDARAARVYLIEAPLDEAVARRVAEELLCDPVTQRTVLGVDPAGEKTATVEVHPRVGVMDPVAQSAQAAMIEMLGIHAEQGPAVRTGWRYDLAFADGDAPDDAAMRAFAESVLANPVVHEVTTAPLWPERFPHGQRYELRVVYIPLRELDDEALRRLSRDAHLFLSLDEMRSIQTYYQAAGREPTDIELETFAQTWSEHCVHKTMKSVVRYRERGGKEEYASSPSRTTLGPFAPDRPGHTLQSDGSVLIDNLLRSTVAAATRLLRELDPDIDRWLVSVFDDNSGIVRFDDTFGVCIKVETHNHPSALEPYGGAATGIGGCIRDIMGTGLVAKPVANTNVFCVAWEGGDTSSSACLDTYLSSSLPPGVIPPARVLRRVVAGVRDYGNRMGIPIVNGAVCFDADYVGNPLVFAGCVGLIPLDRCFGAARDGDRIVALGGRTGRDGIHGATFSSAELTDTHVDEFSHAVQIGNAITQKRLLDVLLQARDCSGAGGEEGPLFSAITDCGAGGFSSAIGEMGEHVGAVVELDRAPLKYQGLSYTEIWISEAQERMVLAVPPERLEALRALAESEDVELADLGRFGQYVEDTNGERIPELILNYRETRVGRISMRLLHEGIPTPVREAVWEAGEAPGTGGTTARSEEAETSAVWADSSPSCLRASVGECLFALLSHPNIASKHWIVRQYDHEVQGGSVVKPLVGPGEHGPGDASVIRPRLDSRRGVALGCGLAPHLSEVATRRGLTIDGDSYFAALAALDEAVRNVVCVGADPARIAVLDNFCWPSCDDARAMGTLVRAAEACLDGALAYATPFISGKDSLHNQFTTDDGTVIAIPPTLLITAMGIVDDTTRCVTMDAKSPGDALILVGDTTPHLGGSHLVACGLAPPDADLHIPRVDVEAGPRNARAVAALIAAGLVRAAHDASEGGLLVAAAEMAFGGDVGLTLDHAALNLTPSSDPSSAALFAETPSRYLLEISPDHLPRVAKLLDDARAPWTRVGTFNDTRRLILPDLLDAPLTDLLHTWQAPLDW